jgi:hypothetical protein
MPDRFSSGRSSAFVCIQCKLECMRFEILVSSTCRCFPFGLLQVLAQLAANIWVLEQLGVIVPTWHFYSLRERGQFTIDAKA